MSSDTTAAPIWGSTYDRMSPAVRAACAADDREFRQAQAAQERDRAARVVHLEERRIRAAVELAEQRGEYVSVAEVARTSGACLGRTRAEAVAYYAAVQDAEDARTARATPPPVDSTAYAAALLATQPMLGRTRAEAVAYYAAVADLQDYEAARAAATGRPTADVEDAQRAIAEKRQATIRARANDHHTRTLAKGAAEGVIVQAREDALLDRWSA